MDRSTKLHYEAALLLIAANHSLLSAAEKQKNLKDFFILLQRIDFARYKVQLDKLKEKWTDFHRKLCDAEPDGEYLQSFLCSGLRVDIDFTVYCLLVHEAIVVKGCTGTELFDVLGNGANSAELIRALKENCQSVPTKVTFKYLNMRVLPAIFGPATTDEERLELCDLVLAMPMGFSVNFMHHDTQQKYKNSVQYKYIPFIYENGTTVFRRHWTTMCRVIIHHSGKILHQDIHVHNAVLKVVEEAFKNPNVEVRCAAFDIWQTLMDNYALEWNYLTGPKQAALLLKPLRARISRHQDVTAKKYDAYVHLMRTIRFSKEGLEQFFVDAFGPLDEDVPELLEDVVARHHLFKGLISTYGRSIEILLKAMHHDKSACECTNKTLPITDCCGVVDGEVRNWEVLVQSVRLGSQLHYVSRANARDDINETVTKCLWSTLFKYLRQDQFKDDQKSILKSVQLAIDMVLNSSSMNTVYYEKFFLHILSCVANFIKSVGFDVQVCKKLVRPVIKTLIVLQHTSGDKLPQHLHSDPIEVLFDYLRGDARFFEFVNELGSGTYTCQLAADLLACAIQHYALTMCKTTSKTEDATLMQLFTNFIVINCNYSIQLPSFGSLLECKALIHSKAIVLIKVFGKLKEDKTMSPGLLKITSKLLLNVTLNKQISDHIFYSHLLDEISSCVQHLGKDEAKHYALISECTQVYLLEALNLIALARADQPLLKIEGTKLMTIYYHLLEIGMYSLLESLALLLDSVERKDVPTKLYELITTLTDHEEEVSQKAFTVFAKIHAKSASSTSTSPSVNGIIKLSPKVKILQELVIRASTEPNTGNTVRIFGNNFESPSSKRGRGSLLERLKKSPKSPTASTSASAESHLRHVDDCSESAFAPIEKKVVVHIDKMSEHQREMTLKRREDIPALYQDLTQSRSMDWSGDKTEVRVTRSSDAAPVQKVTPDKTVSEETKETESKDVDENIKPKRSRKRKQLHARDDPNTNNIVCANASGDEQIVEGVEAEDGESRVDKRNRIELKRLRIDCVGGNDIFNMPKTRRRRSRLLEDKIAWYDIEEEDSVEKNAKTAPESAQKVEEEHEKLVHESEKKKSPKVTDKTDKKDKSPKITVTEAKNDRVKKGTKKAVKEVQVQEEPKKEEPTHQNKLKQSETKTDVVKDDLNEETPKCEESTAESAVINTEEISEDIIPSSQERNVRVNLFRLPHYSPTKKELDDARSRNEKASLKITPCLATKIDFSALDSESNNDETLTMDVTADLPAENIADLDTESFLTTSNSSMNLEVEESTPAKTPRTNISTSSLETSPITPDTPSRNKELLNNTLDISPIRNEIPASNGRASPDLFGSQFSQDNEVVETTATLKKPSWRSAKLLNLVGGVAKHSPARTIVENNLRVTAISSPKTDRIRKMMQNCPDATPTDDQDQPKAYQGDVLEFERSVPSPLALPKSSILKRKMPDTLEEVFSPCTKRKRVNFPDPPTTCEKVYFKVIDEQEKPIALRKKKRFVTRLLEADDADATPEEEDQAEPEDASNAIQSLQDQIDGLDFEGVTPLVSSPPKDAAPAPLSNGRLSPLPSNPAPELLDECMPPVTYENLFPTPAAAANPANPMVPANGLVDFLRGNTSLESYLNLVLTNIPCSDIEKWVKEHKGEEKQTEA